MNTLTTVAQVRDAVKNCREQGLRIALVPTMGNLHSGHIALIKHALAHADVVIASIFVNPIQFGPNEDLATYPRTLQQDQEKLAAAGCHLLFTPSVEEMYPAGLNAQSTIRVPLVSEGLCGGSRPGHFDGVATVVSKLFNIVQPDMAVFGEKDFQQLAVIRKLVADFNLPIEILGAPIVRDADGLALSSRNGYLSDEERQQAPALFHCLKALVEKIVQNPLEMASAMEHTKAQLSATGFTPDYLEVRDADTLAPWSEESRAGVVLVAATIGTTRLIDNLSFTL